jgi:predicted Zn-dependent protease
MRLMSIEAGLNFFHRLCERSEAIQRSMPAAPGLLRRHSVSKTRVNALKALHRARDTSPSTQSGRSHMAAMRKLPVVLLCRSHPPLLKNRNSPILLAIPPRHEGRYGQSSRNVRRGAMDA